jgi:hypothetical protein
MLARRSCATVALLVVHSIKKPLLSEHYLAIEMLPGLFQLPVPTVLCSRDVNVPLYRVLKGHLSTYFFPNFVHSLAIMELQRLSAYRVRDPARIVQFRHLFRARSPTPTPPDRYCTIHNFSLSNNHSATSHQVT